ncbi:hypothetical protein Y032_0080g1317 [Ancylostoma ceylanicum]|uniref:7TM GPCR serpentine receptor class x (Srx) domain-containing protein n=1 Tax=Ancylostoma ceylanicum TaxID=53326 RepID=A0A016TRM4_9BILA|nr:hypothetical protein Y032_0080g1317 [Ancylostoma ceylanicum]
MISNIREGTIIYSICLLVMYRESMLKIPCYRLMFFNGVTDILNLITGSLFAAYFHFNGTVYCSNQLLNHVVGHLTYSFWDGASFNCVILAVNRAVEMLPYARRFNFLFRGKSIYGWMFLSIFYMVARSFLSRPNPFNSSVSSYFFPPFISDDIAWEMSHYAPFLLPLHNIFIAATLIVVYTIVCVYVIHEKRLAHSRTDRMEIMLFLQVLSLCVTTATASLIYVYMNYFTSPTALIIAANIVWQISHGVHGIVYLVVNQQLRRGLWSLFKCKGTAISGIDGNSGVKIQIKIKAEKAISSSH